MHFHRWINRRSCLLVALGLGACAPASPVDGANQEETARQGGAFTTAPQQPNHEEITAEALSFLRPDVVLALQEGNASTDVELALDSAYHFDDCNFSDASKTLAREQTAAVMAFDPNQASPAADAAAALHFGRSLHAAQDFYAHSNWVELGAEGLVDDSLTTFQTLKGYKVLTPSGIQVVEREPPRKISVWRDVAAPYPESAIVNVTTKRTVREGLISGSVDYEPGDRCPADVRMSHADLNKDQSGIPGREAQFGKARALAVQQTRHEWCRLAALTQDTWGAAGEDRLFTWVADPAAAPDCAAESPH